MFIPKERALRHIGAIGVLAFLGLAAALIPIALYSIVFGSSPTNPVLYIVAATIGGGVIGWVTKR